METDRGRKDRKYNVEFLQTKPPVNSFRFKSYIISVANALGKIEKG